MAVDSNSATKQIAFLPWLRLRNAYSVAGVDFVPFREDSNGASRLPTDVVGSLTTILSSYIDREGKSIDDCVVVTVNGRGWNLEDADVPNVEWAAVLLFLASWDSNDYFPNPTGPYKNSSSFRIVRQRFSETSQEITLTSRRREGRTLDGGYRHGEVRFSVPLQCSLRDVASVDKTFLAALDLANTGNSKTIQRLRTALPMVSLANTDDPLMSELAEAILMGSAFEQLLGADGTASKVGCEIGSLFECYGSVKVKDAMTVRHGISIDTSQPDCAAAQPNWWVHRKWAQELHTLRSKSAHKGGVGGKAWGWTPSEHLLMAAWTFPLAVKLLLERNGHYRLTDRDGGHCRAVDRLLAEQDWGAATQNGAGPANWQEIVSSTVSDDSLKRCIDEAIKQCAQNLVASPAAE